MLDFFDKILKHLKNSIFSVNELFWFVFSLHISLIFSKESEKIIYMFFEYIGDFISVFFVIFKALNFFIIINYFQVSVLDVKYQINMKKHFNDKKILENEKYLRIKTKSFLFMTITYFLSLFKYYKIEYIWYYILIFVLYQIGESIKKHIVDIKTKP